MERTENASWCVLPPSTEASGVPRTYINDVANLSVPLFYAKNAHAHTHTHRKQKLRTLKRDEIRKPRERRNEMKHGRNWYVCLKADSGGSPCSLAMVEQGVKHMFFSRALAFYF